jgi:predicted Zn-dependent protease
LFLSFSRKDELEADQLGLRYLEATGRDPWHMARVLEALAAEQDAREGREGAGRLPTRESTHPATEERIDRVQRALAERPRPPAQPSERWFQLLDGMAYGPDPQEGFFVGRTFLHPGMAFRFQIPEKWEGINLKDAVVAGAPEQAAALELRLLDVASAEDALEALFDSEYVEVMEGSDTSGDTRDFTALFDPATQRWVKGVVRFVEHDDRVFGLLAITDDIGWTVWNTRMRRAVESFGPLTDPEILALEPMRLHIVSAREEQTLRTIHEAEASSVSLACLAALNGLDPDQTLEKGRPIKRVTGIDIADAPPEWADRP